ncbi:hypothetical protein [Gloeobacter kilaueensis]|uniref:Uncharacterized protein n=1 Tax=Gloeobacter kilaueensis (strain ATCC BAA-2537 / CCAP 1431/1 / ULC 316 / JS1) TaxID=1183438 RepID=U5QDI5_GLOK1|nr:hypothetical protein [Gloeobacter kilaueensis]AGY56951.1 hypothetical protein GKIL_0705 [Gloeobacter kilaueensis JS1]
MKDYIEQVEGRVNRVLARANNSYIEDFNKAVAGFSRDRYYSFLQESEPGVLEEVFPISIQDERLLSYWDNPFLSISGFLEHLLVSEAIVHVVRVPRRDNWINIRKITRNVGGIVMLNDQSESRAFNLSLERIRAAQSVLKQLAACKWYTSHEPENHSIIEFLKEASFTSTVYERTADMTLRSILIDIVSAAFA